MAKCTGKKVAELRLDEWTGNGWNARYFVIRLNVDSGLFSVTVDHRDFSGPDLNALRAEVKRWWDAPKSESWELFIVLRHATSYDFRFERMYRGVEEGATAWREWKPIGEVIPLERAHNDEYEEHYEGEPGDFIPNGPARMSDEYTLIPWKLETWQGLVLLRQRIREFEHMVRQAVMDFTKRPDAAERAEAFLEGREQTFPGLLALKEKKV